MTDWGATLRVRVEVTIDGGGMHTGFIHLLAGKHWQAGPETPLEMLNRPEGFFPVTTEDGAVMFLAKERVVMVAPEWPAAEAADRVAGEPHGLVVELTTGRELRGTVTVAMPRLRTRTLDCLNALTPFFPLETEGGVRLINRGHVRVARPLD
jgi:hypothetical protein